MATAIPSFVPALAGLLLGLPLAAQNTWRRIDATLPRGEYDPATGAIVGGHLREILAFDGAESRLVAALPGSESAIACVRDRARGNFLVVTDDGNRVLRSRLLHDGQLSAPLAISLAGYGGYAWDPVGARILFLPDGGVAPGLAAWDGAAWSTLSPATMPSARTRFAMATDTLRNRIVLFGGIGIAANLPLGDTWEWDGADWTRATTANAPSPRSWHAMAFDDRLGRVVLFGGQDNSATLTDTWEYDGVDWRPVATAAAPAGAVDPNLAFFPPAARTLISQGQVDREFDAAVHAYDGASWTTAPLRAMPRPRRSPGAVTDFVRQRLVVFGGRDVQPNLPTFFGDTWEWDGSRWIESAATGPAPRMLAGLAYDVLRSRTVLFGGGTSSRFGGTTLFGDTWSFDGAAWTLVAAGGPPGRMRHAMAFAPGSQAVVMFGGEDANGPLGDTWAFDGTNWTDLGSSLAVSPPARSRHGMAFEPVAGGLVLFGGIGPAPVLFGDTWTFDGTWTLRSQAGPGARSDPLLATDLARGRAVLAGGSDPIGPFVDTWSWDGATWVREAVAAPGGFARLSANDPRSGRIVAVSELWSPMEVFTTQPAVAAPYAQGCPGSAGVPVLRAVGAPRLGESAFAVRVDDARGSALVGVAIDVLQVTGPIGNGCWRALGTPTTLGFAFASAAGHAPFALPVPATPALRGFSVFLQGAVLDPQGALAGQLAITPGLRVQVGD